VGGGGTGGRLLPHLTVTAVWGLPTPPWSPGYFVLGGSRKRLPNPAPSRPGRWHCLCGPRRWSCRPPPDRLAVADSDTRALGDNPAVGDREGGDLASPRSRAAEGRGGGHRDGLHHWGGGRRHPTLGDALAVMDAAQEIADRRVAGVEPLPGLPVRDGGMSGDTPQKPFPASGHRLTLGARVPMHRPGREAAFDRSCRSGDRCSAEGITSRRLSPRRRRPARRGRTALPGPAPPRAHHGCSPRRSPWRTRMARRGRLNGRPLVRPPRLRG
jgi:hypothetical protein